MMISWWLTHAGVILSVLMCDIWINVLLQTSALVGLLHVVNWNARWNGEIHMFFPFARSGTSSLGAVTSFYWWVCTPCTRALSTMMCFQSHSTYLGPTGPWITTRRQLWQTRICSWILAQTTYSIPILLVWIQYGRWCFSFVWNVFLC
jgi:uncharacterized membrane protein YqaE (UPF0057 family)